jgi:hypothetical protein
MVRIWIFAMIPAVVVVVTSLGCGQQGPGGTPSGSTEQTSTSPSEESREPATTTEETTIYTTPSGLECPTNDYMASVSDYAMGAKGKKRGPAKLARREFSKKIREGDTVEIAERSRGRHPTTTVRVIREGRVVALIEYDRWREGWLQGHYEACTNF